MYFKLALLNVRRSVRDYTIYFLTLTFGVCVFYVFNSIESQQAMMDVSSVQHEVMKSLTLIMDYVSVFISMILGFLVLYANKFLIKRRKKELGLYMTLGMNKSYMSLILMLETLIIGVISLFIGLVLGSFLSQGLAIITAKMFEAIFTHFEFVFSPSACGKTILYFSLIFILVMVFNSLSISKYKLIDLLSADKKNESFKIKKLWLSVVIFVLSLIFLGSAYYLIIENGLVDINFKFAASLILGSIGSLFFFMSLSGFLLRTIQSNKNVYLKNLNMFVLRQINSKINTTFVSMTMICIMLLFTIGTLSSGIGLADVLTKSARSSTPYDVSFTSHPPSFVLSQTPIDISTLLLSSDIDLNHYSDNLISTNYYSSDLTAGALLSYDTGGLSKQLTAEAFERAKKSPLPLVSLSDFNKQITTLGKEPITLSDNQFVINYDMEQMESDIQSFIKENGTLIINGTPLKKAEDPIMKFSTTTSYMASNSGIVVVPDALVKGLPLYSNQVDFNFKEPVEAYKNAFNTVIEPFDSIPFEEKGFFLADKESVYAQGLSLKIVTSYIAIYVGIIFLITSAAVLALQQLSESSDNIQRYALLRKIGTEEKMINHALFIQVAVYFAMPLALALVHSLVGLYVANDFIALFGNVNVASNSTFTAIIIIFIYGGYFLATYLGSKNMIKSKIT